jgi:hypothetical protein
MLPSWYPDRNLFTPCSDHLTHLDFITSVMFTEECTDCEVHHCVPVNLLKIVLIVNFIIAYR